MDSLIRPDDAWSIWAIMLGFVGLSIYLEQTRLWAAKLTGPVLALIGAITLSNVGVLPLDSPSYDIVWDYIVPLCLPLLLLRASVFKVIRTTGSMFAAFHICALGTVAGAIVAALTFGDAIPFVAELTGIMTGSYIGGGVNFFALAATYRPPEELTSSLLVADNVIMTAVFLLLIALTRITLFRSNFPMPHQEEVERRGGEDSLQAAAFWEAREISLLDIAKALAIAVLIAGAAAKIADAVQASTAPGMIKAVFGNQYLLITAISVTAATIFQDAFDKISGAEELGTYLIYIFFFTIGIPASIVLIVQEAPMLFLFCLVIATVNFVVTFGLGKLFGMKLEDLTISVEAALGGPTGAAALAIAKGWRDLVMPGLLVGLWGYVVGTWLGIAVASATLAILK